MQRDTKILITLSTFAFLVLDKTTNYNHCVIRSRVRDPKLLLQYVFSAGTLREEMANILSERKLQGVMIQFGLPCPKECHSKL